MRGEVPSRGHACMHSQQHPPPSPVQLLCRTMYLQAMTGSDSGVSGGCMGPACGRSLSQATGLSCCNELSQAGEACLAPALVARPVTGQLSTVKPC